MPGGPTWVIATAGHADAGTSTLVRTLTGMTPALGSGWMALPSGRTITLVDVPATAAVTAVLFVVAADRGWTPQVAEHLATLDALGVRHGVVAVTRGDLADPLPVLRRARAELAGTTLADAELVDVSVRTGHGLAQLRDALDRLAGRIPCPDPRADVRLWIDQTAGPVITGTLPVGTLHTGDELVIAPSGRRVRVGSLRSLGGPVATVAAAGRVSMKLQGVDPARVRRGQALVTVGSWRFVSVLDVQLRVVERVAMPAQEHVLHIGSAAVAAKMNQFGPAVARLTLNSPLPLRIGDCGLLRDPSHHRVIYGVTVVDIQPTERHAAGALSADLDGAIQLRRRGMLRRSDLVAMGCTVPPAQTVGEWLFEPDRLRELRYALIEAVRTYAAEHPDDPAMPKPAAAAVIGLPDRRLVEPLARAARDLGLRLRAGRLVLGPPTGITALSADLDQNPFAAPESPRLTELGLTRRVLDAAASHGLLLRLADGVYVHPDCVDRAYKLLMELPEQFTVAQVRTALNTSRRVAVPLLELLDTQGVTERLDTSRRRLRKGRT